MNRILQYLIISILIITITGFLLPQDKKDYGESWKRVEKYVDEGLPRSALKIVDDIYLQSKNEGNEPQKLKSLIYRISLQSRFEEKHIVNAILTFENEIENAKSPEANVLHSLLAELYQWYYQQNRWQINDRSVVVDFEPKDLNTWDAVLLNKTIRGHYLASVQNKENLQNIKLIDFEAILTNANSAGYVLWPSLFDLLGNRALNYFASADGGLAEIGNSIAAIKNDLLLPADEFIKISLSEIDSTSTAYTVLKLYQHLLAYHIQMGNIDARVDLDLKRLQYVLNNTDQSEGATKTYIQTLEKLREEFRANPVFIKLSASLAQKHMELGRKYKVTLGDEYRWELNKAEQICNEAISAFPDSENVAACKYIINDINKTDFDFQVENAVYPGKPILSFLSFKNIEKLHFKIVSVSPDDFVKNRSRRERSDIIKQYLKNPTIQKWTQQLPDSSDHQKHTAEAIIPMLESGFYMVFASETSTFDDEDIIYHTLWVTQLGYMSKNNNADGSIELYVVDRESGIPENDVNIIAYEKRYNPKIRSNEYLHAGDFTTDKSGYAKLDFRGKIKNTSISLMLEKDCELLFSENDAYIYKKSTDSKLKTKTYLFTDRAIYRPGQTVYFKGIVIDREGKDVFIKQGYSAKIEFRNVNRKEISTLELSTNQFGSYQGAFVIPKGGLNGQMMLKTKTGSVNFLVEEYKRPTYQVLFDTIQGEYKLGDEITVTGAAENYTGSSVMNAEVKFRVVRSVIFVPYYDFYSYQRPFPYEQPKEIEHGKAMTDTDGNFRINFTAEAGNTFNLRKAPPYRYMIYADVTDITGEVQSASTQVSIGKEAMMLTFDMKEKIEKESTEGITIHTKNLSGAPINTNAKLVLYKLGSPGKTYINRYWSKPDTYIIDEEDFKISFPNMPFKNENDKNKWSKQELLSHGVSIDGSTSVLNEFLKNADIGEYLIKAKAISKSGDTVQIERFFTLFSSESKKLPGNPPAWFRISNNKAEPGVTLRLSVGSATKKARIYYEIVNGEDIVESKWLTVNNGQKFIDIPVKESYRGNFMVNASLIRNNRQYARSFVVEVPFSNKKLNVSLETHRDHLTPGKKEEWLVKISGPVGEALASELMAGMYDASLDQFRANAWNLSLYHSKRNKSTWTSGYFNAGWARDLYPRRPYPINVKATMYPEINWFDYQHYSMRPPMLRTDMTAGKAIPADGGLDEVEIKGEKPDLVSKDHLAVGGDKEMVEADLSEDKNVNPPRTNFNETAFFYPQLKTDSIGNVIFSFTTPDALTEWKLMMLSHSEDLKVGTLVENIKASKELMVIPNLPRFVRQGDRLVFAAKVVNFTDEEIAPEVTIEFFDPVSMKTVDLFSDEKVQPKRIKIKAKQSALVSWEINIPYDLDLLAYRIRAKSNTFTDGEERMIPVLTNRMLVTETLPMPINGTETKQFSFKDLVISDKIMAISTRSNYRYTVEFTSNPAWYAVQALPYLSEPKMENAGNLFRRYYANALSSFIVNSNPKIQRVFKSWKEVTPDAFYSNLQKNEELKNVILNATPWVLEAEDEAEQKRRIGILFDLNRIFNEKQNALAKLQATQLSSGAWPWFKGMREDRHTTQNIVLGVGKLISKDVINLSSDRDLKQMIRRAVNFLDEHIAEDYNKLKKNNSKGMKNNHLTSFQIEYLYARALLMEDFPIPSKTQTAFDYYFGQAKKYWLMKSNCLQGMIALTMYRFGHRNEAEGIMRSLKERALHNDEMGMYWRQNISWHWYEAPVEAQAMLVDAFDQILNDPKSVEQMKIWLLKQKQAINWKTTGATAEAVYALLLTGQDLLSEDKQVVVTVGSKTIVPKEIEGMKVEAGTGYFKTSWKGEEIIAEMGSIEVTNPNNSIAWGAAYWQYFENLDRIKGHDTPLTMEKFMFVEELTDDGPVMKPMEDGQQLKTGDKVIVRLVIGTDRNMEYVHLKDMRASALEPMDQLSGYSYKGGLGFYRNVTDVSTEFFIQYLNKGTYVLEYPLMVTQKGEFSNGIATIQSYYAPEFAAHSEGKRIIVK